MSYEPTSWQNGDIVTASKLNNIEQGIENLSETKGTADILLDGASAADAGKILTIDDTGQAVLTPYAEMYGSPLAAQTPSGMTDTSRIYVYSGEEIEGYTPGSWYFYNGSEWEKGGNYESRSDLTSQIIDDDRKLPTSKAVYDGFRHLIDLIYPIGSLYFSTSPINPGTYLGGNWIRYAEGRTIFGASDTDTDFQNREEDDVAVEIKTGGSKVTAYAVGGPNGHNHRAGTDDNQYPANRFLYSSDSIKDLSCNITESSSGAYIVPAIAKNNTSDTTAYDGFATTLYTDHNLGNYIEGYGSVFTANNLPPYVSCYIWMRVADNYSPVISASAVPDYPLENVYLPYQDRVQAVVASLNALDNESNQWSHFIFITDPHSNGTHSYKPNLFHSPGIAMYIAAHSNAKKIILGGDYCEGHWGENKYDYYMNFFKEAGFADYVYPVSGNHERMLPKVLTKDTSYPDSGFVAAQSRARICNDFLLSKSNIVGNIQEGYYYIDDSSKKIRYLFINTSDTAKQAMSDNQLRWIRSVATVKPGNDWVLVVFGHANIIPMPLKKEHSGDPQKWTSYVEEKNGADIEQALRNWSGYIAAYFCGHQHIDSHRNNANFHHFTFYCDRFSTPEEDAEAAAKDPNSVKEYLLTRPPKRERNTETDSCVTVVSIQLGGTRDVIIRRVGAGLGSLNKDDNPEQKTSVTYDSVYPT